MGYEYGTSGKEFDTPKEIGVLPTEFPAASYEISEPAKEYQLSEEFDSSVSVSDKNSKKKEHHRKHKNTLRKMVYALASTAMVVTLAKTVDMGDMQITTPWTEDSAEYDDETVGIDDKQEISQSIRPIETSETIPVIQETVSTETDEPKEEIIAANDWFAENGYDIYGIGDRFLLQSKNFVEGGILDYTTWLDGNVVYNGDGTKTITAMLSVDTYYDFEIGWSTPGWGFRLTDRYNYELIMQNNGTYLITQEDGTQIDIIPEKIRIYNSNSAFRDTEATYVFTVPEDYDDLVFAWVGLDEEGNASEELLSFFAIEENSADSYDWTKAKDVEFSSYMGIHRDYEGTFEQAMEWEFFHNINTIAYSDYTFETEGRTNICGYLEANGVNVRYINVLDYETGRTIDEPDVYIASEEGNYDVLGTKEEFANIEYAKGYMAGADYSVYLSIPNEYEGRFVIHTVVDEEEYYTLVPEF